MPFENYEDDQTRGRLKILIAAIALILIVAGSAAGAYKIMSPRSEPVKVVPPADLTAPTFNGTSLITGDTLQITTTLTDKAPGVQVNFYENNIPIGSAFTNSAGEAIINRLMPNNGTFYYTADCIHT